MGGSFYLFEQVMHAIGSRSSQQKITECSDVCRINVNGMIEIYDRKELIKGFLDLFAIIKMKLEDNGL